MYIQKRQNIAKNDEYNERLIGMSKNKMEVS